MTLPLNESERLSEAPAVRPERLLARTRAPRFIETTGQRAAATTSRGVLLKLLGRMTKDRLVIVDGEEVLEFGAPDSHEATLKASMHVHDQRAWKAVASEGSIGLGRGYIEGWWSSEDATAVVRVMARNIDSLDEIRNRIANITTPLTDRARRVLPSPGRDRNREDISSHYDLGNDFFRIFLDETMTYSSGVFRSPLGSMADASLAKYDRLLEKLRVESGHSLLEIGTGWGGMAIRAASHVGARVTTTTISKEQFAEAGRRVREAVDGGTVQQDQITLKEADWRDLDGRHDRLVSVEMIEAVNWRDYPKFFKKIEDSIPSDGMAGLQAICIPDNRFHRAKNTEDFIRRFVFPGGFLPSLGAIGRAVSRSTRLEILDVEDFGAHYAETLRRWRIRFDERIAEVRALGLDDRFIRLWRFYLSYCEAAFLERSCTVNQIVLVGPDWRPDGLDLRPA